MRIIKTLKTLVLSSLCMAALASTATAQTTCTTCTATLPTLPLDTIFMNDFPDATKGTYYEEVVNFRFPHNVAGLGSFAPSGAPNIPLNAFVITGVRGLPVGLSWTGDRALPMRYSGSTERDGCIRICGTPLQSGTFTITVQLSVESMLDPIAQNIPVTFVVHPNPNAVTTFTMNNAMGCDSDNGLTVEMNNEIIPSGLPNESYTYEWDFGNGETSTEANPEPVRYTSEGTYTVSMRAISTLSTPRAFLNSIRVTGVGCTDNFLQGSAVDIFAIVSSVNGIDTTTGFTTNLNPPVTFDLGNNINLLPNTVYTINIKDDEAIAAGLPAPEDCGSVTFNSDTLATQTNFTLSLTSGALALTATITRDTLHERDTMYTEDIVVVEGCISVTEYELNQVKLAVYPNPTSNNVNVDFDLSNIQNETVSLMLTDVVGRVLISQDLTHLTGSMQRETLSLNEYGAGVYFLQMQIGDKQISKKIVVLP